MRFFRLFLIATLSFLWSASPSFGGLYNCNISKDKKNTKIVVSYEGLAGELLGYQVYNNIGKRLQRDFKGKVDVVGYSFPQGPLGTNCIMKKYKYVGKNITAVVMGHSYGGKFGLLNTIAGLKQKGFPMDRLYAIGIDPRQGADDVKWIFSFGNLVQIQNPGAGHFANFYQRGLGLPGYMVNGAYNCRTTGTDHVFMPTRPEIYATAWSIIKGNGIPVSIFQKCYKYNNLIAGHTNDLKVFKTNPDGTPVKSDNGGSDISGLDPRSKDPSSTVSTGKVYKCCINGICRSVATYAEADACQKQEQRLSGNQNNYYSGSNNGETPAAGSGEADTGGSDASAGADSNAGIDTDSLGKLSPPVNSNPNKVYKCCLRGICTPVATYEEAQACQLREFRLEQGGNH